MMDTFDKIMAWAFGVICFVLFSLLIIGAVGDRMLYDDCIADGHKKYECVGVLRGRSIK